MQTKNEKTNSPFGGLFDGVEVIHQYTRQNMIDDGFLVEVPADLARQAGFVVPVGVLIEVWEDAVAWSEARPTRDNRQHAKESQTCALSSDRVQCSAIRRECRG